MKPKKSPHGRFPEGLVKTYKLALLDRRSRAVLMVMIVMAGAEGECWPSRRTLRDLSGLKKLRDVDLGIETLVDRDLIAKQPRYRDDRQTSNLYKLTLPYPPVPFGRMPHWIIYERIWAGLSHRAQAVLVVLQALALDQRWAFEKRKSLMVLAGLSKLDYLDAAVKELEDVNLILREWHPGSGSRTRNAPNVFILAFEPWEPAEIELGKSDRPNHFSQEIPEVGA